MKNLFLVTLIFLLVFGCSYENNKPQLNQLQLEDVLIRSKDFQKFVIQFNDSQTEFLKKINSDKNLRIELDLILKKYSGLNDFIANASSIEKEKFEILSTNSQYSSSNLGSLYFNIKSDISKKFEFQDNDLTLLLEKHVVIGSYSKATTNKMSKVPDCSTRCDNLRITVYVSELNRIYFQSGDIVAADRDARTFSYAVYYGCWVGCTGNDPFGGW
jgi:hypothetical protein